MQGNGQRILLVDDNADIHEILTPVLEEQGYEVIHAYNGKDALDRATRDISLCLLDIMLPDIQGLEVCKEIRKSSLVPIIFVSAKGDDIDKIIGIELGADDYVVKPFNSRELLARIKAVLRRCTIDVQTVGRGEVKLGGLCVDINRAIVSLNGERISCTPKEMEMLYAFVSNPGKVFTRAELLSSIWGYTLDSETTRTVDTHIRRIREKIERPDFGWKIKTVYRKGYRLDVR